MTPQIMGTVYAPDGFTPTDAVVSVFLGDGRVLQKVNAPGGDFLIGGLPTGGYWLQAFPASDDPFWKSNFQGISVTGPDVTQTITMTLTMADLWGIAQTDQGNPVHNAHVIAAHQNGDHQSDRTSSSGYWAIGGLTDGTYTLIARPPWPDEGLIPPDPITTTLPGSTNPYTITFGSPPKIVEGSVSTNTGTPVFQAKVVANRLNLRGQAETLTEADGTYELSLAPGLWSLTVRSITNTVPLDWVYPHPPQLVYFQNNDSPESHHQDFIVINADATVIGEVEMPDGSVPPFTVTVGLHNDEGVGVRTTIHPDDGTYNLPVPNGGYKVVVHPDDPGYLGPEIDPIYVSPESTYDLGRLTLLARDELITGTISSDSLAGVERIPMVAWRPGIVGSLKTFSGPEGLYALAVSDGTWHIRPAPTHDQPYLYTGTGERVTVAANSVISNVNFTLLSADAKISGLLVDENDDPANDAEGWATAQQTISTTVHNGSPIIGGLFTINVPGGTYKIAAILSAGSPYMSTGEKEVSVSSGETVTVTLSVEEKDAAIVGALWDPRNQDVVEGLAGGVGAWNNGNWAAKPINTGNGSYRLDVAAGLWHLNYRIDPTGGYAKLSGPKNVTVQSGQTVPVPLPIVPKDGAITGTVLTPEGFPLAGSPVLAKGITGDVSGLFLQTRSEEDGSFRLEVPYGGYRLGASNGNVDWIKPIEITLTVPSGGVSGDHVLQFLEPDAIISGTLTITNTASEGFVHVWAWSDDGGFVRGRFPVTLDNLQEKVSGPYQLDVISNTTWHMGAVFETEIQYWVGRKTVSVGSGGVVQDLILKGPLPKPAPVVVTFDAANPQLINLADGTHIFIPAGAMPVNGYVTLRIVPIATIPHQQHANILKYGYAFLATDESGQPIEDHFNQDVVIHFAYDESELAQQHIIEQWLKPAYFSTTTNMWTFPESFVVDTNANRVIMQIDHFTDFALTGTAAYSVYLSIVAQ